MPGTEYRFPARQSDDHRHKYRATEVIKDGREQGTHQPIDTRGMYAANHRVVPGAGHGNSQHDHSQVEDQMMQYEFLWRERALDDHTANSNQNGSGRTQHHHRYQHHGRDERQRGATDQSDFRVSGHNGQEQQQPEIGIVHRSDHQEGADDTAHTHDAEQADSYLCGSRQRPKL